MAGPKILRAMYFRKTWRHWNALPMACVSVPEWALWMLAQSCYSLVMKWLAPTIYMAEPIAYLQKYLLNTESSFTS